MMESQRWFIAGLLIMSLGFTAIAWAEQPASMSRGRDRVDELMGRYSLSPAFTKLGRGVSNALLGWLEIPLNVQKRYTTSDTVGSGLAGAAIGIFKGAVRMGVGVYETVTFFLPYPEHFEPILPTLEYFQKHTKRQPLPLE
jgi:putative exosortase-associated protein (TIGR04073 family)